MFVKYLLKAKRYEKLLKEYILKQYKNYAKLFLRILNIILLEYTQ